MIKITKHTSDICGCVTWYEWDDQVSQELRVHTDIAVSPCEIHNKLNFGKTLLVDTASLSSENIVRGSTPNITEKVSDIRPGQIKDIIPLSITVDARKEMHLKEDARSVLIQVEGISQEAFDENGKPQGREFKDGIITVFEFDKDRKLVISLDGAQTSEKESAETALSESVLDNQDIKII